MSLTKSQLETLVDTIRRRFVKFRYDALGDRALTEDEIDQLKRLGLLRRGTRHMVSDPAILGKIMGVIPPSRRRMTYDELLDRINTIEIPLTDIERQAIEYATEHAGAYIQGIEDIAVKTARTSTSRAGMSALRAVQEGVAEAVAKRKSISELRTDLFDMLDDQYRDWQRVAHTEINTAIQQGIYREIREKSDEGEDQLVFKRPAPDACNHCKRLYLDSDGITPKIFKLKDLAESNIGLKAQDWQPTIGSVHPWCHCQLGVVPEGYAFERVKVAAESVRGYKAGQIISEGDYRRLTDEEKEKVRDDAALRSRR